MSFFNLPQSSFLDLTPRQVEGYLPSSEISVEDCSKLYNELATLYDKTYSSSNRLNEPLVFKNLTNDNYSEVEALLRSFFFPTSQAKELINIPNCSNIAYFKDQIVGGILLSPLGYIEYIFVCSHFRGNGLASNLITKSRVHFPVLHLHVDPANSALSLYHKLGFEVEEYCPWFYVQYLPADSLNCRHAIKLKL
ncbi:hypothetical protein RCL1_005123 [Eukaryota sp. TZLM3-RCL]